jgi:hypothetical protein
MVDFMVSAPGNGWPIAAIENKTIVKQISPRRVVRRELILRSFAFSQVVDGMPDITLATSAGKKKRGVQLASLQKINFPNSNTTQCPE